MNTRSLIIFDKPALLEPLYAQFTTRFDIHMVHSLKEILHGLNLLHADVIILTENTATQNAVDLALELKQSIVAKDLPILVMTPQVTPERHAPYLEYFGISILDVSRASTHLFEKITELKKRYHMAKEFQKTSQTTIQSHKIAINARINALFETTTNSQKKVQSCSLLLFQLNLQKVKTSLRNRSQVNQEYLDTIIHACIAQCINEEGDYLVPAEQGRFFVISPMVEPDQVTHLAERINELLYYTTKSETAKISLDKCALHVGIVTTHCNDTKGRQNVFESAEIALENAIKNAALYFRV